MRSIPVAMTAAAAVSVLLLSACEHRGVPPDAVGWKLDAELPAEVIQGAKQPIPGIVPVHLQPLDGHIPLLWVNGATDMTAVAPDSRNVWVNFALPISFGETVYLRIAPDPLDASTCPAAGTPFNVGTANLEAIDKFPHPLRSRIVGGGGGGPAGTWWNPREPRLASDRNYYLQACVIDFDDRYTDAGTNTVTVELITGLPDLVITNAGVLRRTDTGKVYFIVADRIPRSPRIVRGTTIEYEVSTPSGSVPTVRTSAPLAPSGLSWIVSDFRIPDDGAFHDVTIRINMAHAVPETNYDNNVTTYQFRVRATPAVIVVDNLTVRENCDGISPGDWEIAVLFPYRSGPRVAPSGTRYCFARSTGRVDVDDNTSYPLNIGFEMIDLPQTDGAYVEVWAEDCDSWTAGCGEEFEIGVGGNFAGIASFVFNSGDRASGTSQTQTSRDGDCGDDAFTATVRYLDRAAADASGVRIYETVDVSGVECTRISPPSP